MADLNTAITLDIRSVDICTRYSSTAYLVLLLNAPASSVDTIMERISDHFYQLQGSREVALRHQVVEDVSTLL